MSETKPGSSRFGWLAILAFAVAWCLYVGWRFGFLPARSAAPVLDGTALTQTADYNWPLWDLDGRPVSFGQYRGKTVLLNIWATWCPPCVAELPSIAALARRPGLDRVAFVCVAIDDDRETVRQFVQGKDWPMTVLHAKATPPAFTTPEGAIPTTFVVAPDGRIAASAVGGADWNDPSVVAFLERTARP
jgi:thiol-disulfide isomerase/thioredoxin